MVLDIWGKLVVLTMKKPWDEMVKTLEFDGWRVIKLYGKSPDAIAVKENKIVAVEVLKQWRKERTDPIEIKKYGKNQLRYYGGFTMASKRSNYDMFDDVFFKTFQSN
jgi:hypothetical protein